MSDRWLNAVMVAVTLLASGRVSVGRGEEGQHLPSDDRTGSAALLINDADRHIQVLLQGVSRLSLSGTVGDLSVFGPNAIPVVVAGSNSKEGGAPIIAVATHGRGRLVAMAHDQFLEFPSGENESERQLREQLLGNLIRWAAAAHDVPGRPLDSLRLAVRGRWGMTDWLKRQNVHVVRLPDDDVEKALEGIDVVVTGVFDDLSETQIAVLSQFVQRGGGIIAAGPGWAWQGYRAGPGRTLPEHHTGNRLFAPAGIVWGGGTVQTPPSGQLEVSRPRPEWHARLALEALADRQPTADARGTKPDSGVLVATVTRALVQIPQRDQLLRPRVDEFLSERQDRLKLPSHHDPLKPSDVESWLAVTLQAARLRSLPAEQVEAHPAAALFPGSIPAGAERRTVTRMIDTRIPDWHSTGMYAAPGDVVRVEIPPAAVPAGLKVRVGCHQDTLWHRDEWRRFPEVTVEASLTQPETGIASAFGGLIYLVVPRDCQAGQIRVQIHNAVHAPRFVLNTTDLSDWRLLIREFPAPWAELESRKIILTVPSEVVRGLDYPDQLMQWWDRVLDAQADLRAIPRDRLRPERIVVDRQISAGYLHAGYPIMGYYHHGAEAVDLASLKSKGNWGFYHELGHNHQHPDWTYNGMGEVTVNLFSLYCYDTINPGVPVHPAVRPDAVAEKIRQFRRDGRKGDPFLELIPYMQMQQAFGWDVYRQVFAEYDALEPAERPRNDREKRDQWLIRMSRATGHNLTRFFDFWKIEVSEAAREQVSGLPVWYPEELNAAP